MNGTRVLAIVFVALLVLGVLSAAWAPSSRAPASAAAANTRRARSAGGCGSPRRSANGTQR